MCDYLLVMRVRDNIATRAIEAGEKLTVRSALNPVLWLCAIVSIPALVVVPFLSEPPVWLIVLICLPVMAATIGFFFLLFFDRDKLQSEDYQLKKRSLEIIEQKGDQAPMVLEADSLKVVPKPDIGQLTDGEG